MKQAKGMEEKKKIKGWSIEEMKKKPRDDSEEEMIEWRSMSQEEMDECGKKLAEKIEEEVLDKYKVEDNKRGAYRGRGSVLEWRRVRRSRKYRRRRLFGKNFRLVQGKNLQRLQSMHEDATEGE